MAISRPMLTRKPGTMINTRLLENEPVDGGASLINVGGVVKADSLNVSVGRNTVLAVGVVVVVRVVEILVVVVVDRLVMMKTIPTLWRFTF
jgi:hypothetical protein